SRRDAALEPHAVLVPQAHGKQTPEPAGDGIALARAHERPVLRPPGFNESRPRTLGSDIEPHVLEKLPHLAPDRGRLGLHDHVAGLPLAHEPHIRIARKHDGTRARLRTLLAGI